MTIKKYFPLIATLIYAVIALFILFSGTSNVHANPESFMYSSTNATNNTVTATSSVAWQTAGTATTTVVLNGVAGNSFALKNATLLLYRLGAGGTSKTRVDIEYSNNCSTSNPDWYSNATTSVGTTVTSGNTGVTWQFASSTIGMSSAASNYDTIALQFSNVPTNCIRAVLTVPAGAASSSIWGEWVGKKEVQ